MAYTTVGLCGDGRLDDRSAGRTDRGTGENSRKGTLPAEFWMLTGRLPLFFPAFPKERTHRIFHGAASHW